MTTNPEAPLNETQAHFVEEQTPTLLLEHEIGQGHLLESLFISINGLGRTYAHLAADQLEGDAQYHNMIAEKVIAKEYQHLQKPKTMDAYRDAVKVGRETETVKRAVLARVIEERSDLFSPVERELFGEAIILSQCADRIFFDEWLPGIRDNDIGQTLRKMEDEVTSSSLKVLPGTPDSMRWFSRTLIDPQQPVTKENIRLVPYKEAFPTVLVMINSLQEAADHLEQLKKGGHDDFGYIEYFRAWATCLDGDNSEIQKQKEDEMFRAWRRINSEAPLYIVAWAENEYEDPAAIAMVPSFRAGVLDSSEQAQELRQQEAKLKKSIIQYTTEHNIFGGENLKKTHTHYRIWSLFGGSDMLFGISSEFLPNDPTLQSTEGAGIFPDLQQQEIGHNTRDVIAQKVYPEGVLNILRNLRFNAKEGAIYEIQAHELNHLPAVTLEAINAFGKTRNLFEEAKATLGGLIAQIRTVRDEDSEFQKRAAATLLHAAPRYIAIDGNPTYQGYVNDTRVILIAAEKAEILTFDAQKGWQLDLDHAEKITLFWQQIEAFVTWTYNSYSKVTEADPDQRQVIADQITNELGYWVGNQSEPEATEIHNHTILAMKAALE